MKVRSNLMCTSIRVRVLPFLTVALLAIGVQGCDKKGAGSGTELPPGPTECIPTAEGIPKGCPCVESAAEDSGASDVSGGAQSIEVSQSCKSPYSCINGICQEVCEQGREGCACSAESPCDEGLVCDTKSQKCRAADGCDDFGCLQYQMCLYSEDNAQIECVAEECEPGFEWEEENARCEPIRGAGCAPDSEVPIEALCEGLRRVCDNDESPVRCGKCVEGTRARGSECIQSATCESLACETEGRACIAPQRANRDAYCGDCLEGRILEGEDCVLEAQDCSVCEEQSRICEMGEEISCGECVGGMIELPDGQCVSNQCPEDLVFDAQVGGCRPLIICEALDCGGDEGGCIDGRGVRDAKCACEPGEGLDIGSGECLLCPNGNRLNCQGADTTGRVMIYEQNGNCVCQPAQGYFYDVESLGIAACDADQDGWSHAGLISIFEGDNPELRALTAESCTLRTVRSVLFVPENGEAFSIDVNSLAPGLLELPLYESKRNDGGTGRLPDDYHGTLTPPRSINSLTKACASSNGDFNDNGAYDISEWEGASLGQDVLGFVISQKLERYFNAYKRFSYFLELYDGWYEPLQAGQGNNTGISVGRYIIAERSRLQNRDASMSQMPLGYPTIDLSPWFSLDEDVIREGHTYWRQCERKRDATYSPQDVPSRAGGDFTSIMFRDENGLGQLKHHSQFKCIEFVSEESYNSLESPKSLEEHPHLVYKEQGARELLRKYRDPGNAAPEERETEHNRWYLNWCMLSENATGPLQYYSGQVAELMAGGPIAQVESNPQFSIFHCFTSLTNNEVQIDGGVVEALPGQVFWAAVGFQNFDPDDRLFPGVEGVGEQGNANAQAGVYRNSYYGQYGEYARGCINECFEKSVTACPGYQSWVEDQRALGRTIESPELESKFTCDDENPDLFGKLQCGCKLNYSGPECEKSCTTQKLLHSPQFDVETRSGLWMCSQSTESGPVVGARDAQNKVYLQSRNGRIKIKGHVPHAGKQNTALEGQRQHRYTITGQ